MVGLRNFSLANIDPALDYYEHLGLKANASKEEIKSKYYELAKKHHPDLQATASQKQSKAQNDFMFKKVSAAYTVLSDPKLKQQYDDLRNTRRRQSYTERTSYYDARSGQFVQRNAYKGQNRKDDVRHGYTYAYGAFAEEEYYRQ